MADRSPLTISKLYYLLDKRLSLIEQALGAHAVDHKNLHKVLDDHETRLRTGFTIASLISGTGGLVALIAIIRSFTGK